MSSWNTGPFDNDAALDLLEEIAEDVPVDRRHAFLLRDVLRDGAWEASWVDEQDRVAGVAGVDAVDRVLADHLARLGA
jgi:hypothetical protein